MFHRHLPIVQITQSQTKKTGTISFLFLFPLDEFNYNLYKKGINGILIQKKTLPFELKYIYREGKPSILLLILFFQKGEDWFHLLDRIYYYSRKYDFFFVTKQY